MPNAQGSGDSQGQPQTADPAGTGHAVLDEPEAGTPNDPGVFGEIAPRVDYTTPPPDKKEPAPQSAVPPPAPVSTPPPSPKDERHAQTKINDLVDQKIAVAEKLIEKDADAIYEIAESDPDLAVSLLKRHSEYETNNVEDLLARKEAGTVDLEGVAGKVQATSKEVKELRNELMESRISEMRTKHPDLKGELEQKFREMYNDPRFKDYGPDKLYKVVKALHGKEQQPSMANDVGLDILKQQEGATVHIRGGEEPQKKSKLTPDQRKVMEGFDHSEKDLETFLPENIDEILNE